MVSEWVMVEDSHPDGYLVTIGGLQPKFVSFCDTGINAKWVDTTNLVEQRIFRLLLGRVGTPTFGHRSVRPNQSFKSVSHHLTVSNNRPKYYGIVPGWTGKEAL